MQPERIAFLHEAGRNAGATKCALCATVAQAVRARYGRPEHRSRPPTVVQLYAIESDQPPASSETETGAELSEKYPQSEIAALLAAPAIANGASATETRQATAVCVIHGVCEETSVAKPVSQATPRTPNGKT